MPFTPLDHNLFEYQERAKVNAMFSELFENQAPVSGGGIADTRTLANWFGGGSSYDGRSILFCGDSTTEQLAGINYVAYAGTTTTLQASLEPSTIGRISLKNRGANGQTLAGFVSAGSANNAGGVGAKLDDICTELATLTRPLVVLCYGINDVRTDATIAGQAYGSAAHQIAANALRALLVTACARMVAANSSVSIILRMPNGMRATAAGLLTNSVTGQNAMDVLRLAYRGDSTYSTPPADELIGGNVQLFDSMRVVYGDTAYASALVHPDGLHPSNAGYERTLAGLFRMIVGPEATALASVDSFTQALRFERSAGHGAVRPRVIADIKNSGEWDLVGTTSVLSAEATYFDVSFDSAAHAQAAWGATSGAYGSGAQPQMGVSDVMVWEPSGLAAIVMPVGRMADALTGSYVRWYSGGPDGSYPSSTVLPVGSTGTLWRHKWSAAGNYRRNVTALAAGGIRAALAYRNAYRAFITSATSGSITLRGIGGLSTSLAAKTLTTSDTICILGVDDTASGGVPLTGATFTQPDSATGVCVINLAGRDFTRFAFRQAAILSNT